MKRRSFFTAVTSLFGGGVAATAVKAVEPVATMKPDVFEMGGWKFRWMGWQSYPASYMFYGAWVATHPLTPGDFAYSTTYGIVREAPIGCVMDLTIPYGAESVTTPDSSDEQKERKKTMALIYLMDYCQRSGRG